MGDIYSAGNYMASLIPALLTILYFAVIGFVISLLYRLVRATEKIAKKMTEPPAANSADAKHIEQIAESLDAGLRSASSDAR